MMAMNGLNNAQRPAAISIARRCAANVMTAIARLLRPARVSRQAWEFTLRQFAIAAAVAIAAILLCMVFVDAAATGAVPRLPRAAVWFFHWVTDFGKSGWFLWPLGILFLLLAALPQERLTRVSQGVLAAAMVRVGFLFLAIGAPGLFVTVLKRVIGRARPMVTGVIDPFVFAPFKWTAAYASLPSGHATTAFSVLVAVGTLWPRARTVLWIYALLIAASRVAVRAHFPSDVLAGALVGMLGALLVRRYFALRHLGFSLPPDGVPHQYPGPSRKRIKAVARALLS